MSELEKSIEGPLGDALRAPAAVPLGMTARLEMSVVRRSREGSGFSPEEKICAVTAALGVSLLGSGPLNVGLLLIAGVVALGYAQATVLVGEEG